MIVLWPHGPFISFACPKETKQRKGTGCTFLAIPSAVSAKQKELASLKQLFVFNAPKSTSASRSKSEAGPLCSFATLLRSLMWVFTWSVPAFSGEAWRKMEIFPWRTKSCLSDSEFFSFRKNLHFLALEREPANFLFVSFFFCSGKRKMKGKHHSIIIS